jgi:hypothetical protein
LSMPSTQRSRFAADAIACPGASDIGDLRLGDLRLGERSV